MGFGNMVRHGIRRVCPDLASGLSYQRHKENFMLSGQKGRRGAAIFSAAAGLLAAAGGCYSDKPHDYGRERPDVYDLDRRDAGLQSKDVNEAADRMAADLLSDPKLNASKTQWTIVTTPMQDRTIDRRGQVNYDIFIQALQGRLAQHGGG